MRQYDKKKADEYLEKNVRETYVAMKELVENPFYLHVLEASMIVKRDQYMEVASDFEKPKDERIAALDCYDTLNRVIELPHDMVVQLAEKVKKEIKEGGKDEASGA
jgi:hypothetical protein